MATRIWLRGFPPVRDLPVVIALVVAAVTALLPGEGAEWLALHLVLLFAASHAIIVWSRHFADTLLRLPTSDDAEREQTLRLIAFDGGAVTVMIGVLTGSPLMTLLGTLLTGGVAVLHAWLIFRDMRHALGSRFASAVRFYISAALLLVPGVLLGALLTVKMDEEEHERLEIAHSLINVFGWIGLAVLGTLVTLWPTMLRTPIAAGAEQRSFAARIVLSSSVSLSAIGVLLDSRTTLLVGLGCYLLGVLLLVQHFAVVAKRKLPRTMPTLSAFASLAWLAFAAVSLLVTTLQAGDWEVIGDAMGDLAPLLAVGFVVQILLGALTYLIPVMLGGGPAAVRESIARIEWAGRSRVLLANIGLLLTLNEGMSTIGWYVAALAFATFAPLLARTVMGRR